MPNAKIATGIKGKSSLIFQLCVNSIFSLFHATGLFLYLRKGGIERDQWREISSAVRTEKTNK